MRFDFNVRSSNKKNQVEKKIAQVNRSLANNGKVEKPITEKNRSLRTGAMRRVLARDK